MRLSEAPENSKTRSVHGLLLLIRYRCGIFYRFLISFMTSFPVCFMPLMTVLIFAFS